MATHATATNPKTGSNGNTGTPAGIEKGIALKAAPGRAMRPPAAPRNLLAAKGQAYGEKADAADAALARLNILMGSGNPGSETLVIGHGI